MFDYSLAYNILNFGLVAGTGTLAVTLASTAFKFTNPVGQEWDRVLKKMVLLQIIKKEKVSMDICVKLR